MTGQRIEDFRYRDHRLVYETHGEGPRVLVLMHGLLLDASLNRAMAQSLAALGHRVILLELLGHGRSDRPRHASEHRMDAYALQVVALLDHLELEQAAIGGTSLGANVTLQVAELAPQRVRGMYVEMPVLEWAAPAAGAVFIPLLLAVHYGRPVAGLISRLVGRVPRTGFGPLDSFLNSASMAPEEIAAVLHGILVGPSAPTVEARQAMSAPALILGHGLDYVHPFSDAENLAEQLPNARMLRARSMFELRTRPTRLTGEIADFLDEVWRPTVAAEETG